MQQIQITRDFFKNATRDYECPVFAWVREIFQNSADAPGCRNITVTIKEVGGTAYVEVTNDGSPMDKRILTQKLLALGGSEKAAGAVGGFGKAKELLYFCQKNWNIRTGSYQADGCGGSYELTNIKKFDGTISSVHTIFPVSEIKEAFNKVITLSNWKGKFTVDGKVVTERLHNGFYRKSWNWGHVYTNRQSANRLVVRIGGIPMFSRYCDYKKGTVVVELVGSSVDTLTSNRDSLVYDNRLDLDALIQSIAVDKRSAFKWTRWIREVFAGEEIGVNVNRVSNQTSGGRFAGIVATALNVAPSVRSSNSPEVAGTQPVDTTPVELPTFSNDRNVSVSHRFVVKNGLHKSCGRQRAVPTKFTPTEDFSPYSRKLTTYWIKLLTALYKLDNREGKFGVGFVFDDETMAQHETSGDETTFLINPTVMKGDLFQSRFHFTKDKAKLISYAAHEYAHVSCGQHDEDYAAELTRVMELVVENYRELMGCFK